MFAACDGRRLESREEDTSSSSTPGFVLAKRQNKRWQHSPLRAEHGGGAPVVDPRMVR